MLMVIPDLIILPLAYIINVSFLTGEYPHLLKQVKVIPIYKGGSSQDIKVIEKLIHKRLYTFLEDHNIVWKPIWFSKK